MNLRQLSRQFARGQIDRAEYQRHRAELIERVLASLTNDSEHTDPHVGGPEKPRDTPKE